MAEKQQQTSIHIQPVKAGSEQHNKREKQLSYVMPSRTSLNEYWESDTQAKRLADIKKLVKEKTGRKMQKAATPIREGVVVIKPTTTMDNLKELAANIEHFFGIHVFQIAIHRDEGKDADHVNWHAHLVMDFVNHNTGRSIKIGREGASQIQSICAGVLGMNRGKSSDRQHLNAIQFKLEREKKRLEHIRFLRQRLQEEWVNTGIIENLKKLVDLIGTLCGHGHNFHDFQDEQEARLFYDLIYDPDPNKRIHNFETIWEIAKINYYPQWTQQAKSNLYNLARKDLYAEDAEERKSEQLNQGIEKGFGR